MKGFTIRRSLICLLAACALVAPALAQDYPNKPIRMLVPFTPGGGTDILARIVAGKMSESMGQQVIVENKPGANTLVASEAVAKAAPDGYTLLMQTNNLASNPTLYQGKMTFDTLKDLVPVALVAGNPHVLVVHPSVPAKNLKEFIALARAEPGALLMGSAGTGSNTHLTGELFQSMAKVKLLHVPYKGAGAAIVV